MIRRHSVGFRRHYALAGTAFAAEPAPHAAAGLCAATPDVDRLLYRHQCRV